MSTATKLEYLNDTKTLLKYGINSIGGNITDQTTFRQYATQLDNIYASLAKVSGTGSNINLTPTKVGRITSQINGDTLQDGTPTPDSPVAIQSVTGNQVISVCGKNLFDKRVINWSTNTTIKYQSIYLGAGTYTISSPDMPYDSNGKNIFILAGQVTSGANSNTNGVDKDTPRTITTSDGYITIGNRYKQSETLNLNHPEDYNWIIEKGSTATTYEAYSGETYPINLGTIELNGIDNYKNYIVGTPNNWSITGQPKIMILDGTETWWYDSRDTANYSYRCTRQGHVVASKLLCSHYPYASITNSNTNQGIDVRDQSNNWQIRIRWGQQDTIENFQEWLSNHNVKLLYVSTTEDTTPITNQELITQLNNWYYAMSKNGQTNISVDGNLSAILDVSVLKGEE